VVEVGEPPEVDLVVRFERDMEQIYFKAKAVGYNATRYLALVREYGGLAAAHRLLSSDRIHDGFAELLFLDRKDLTVESLVLQPEYVSLFSPEELDRARARLGR
jgi:hypothetical protein